MSCRRSGGPESAWRLVRMSAMPTGYSAGSARSQTDRGETRQWSGGRRVSVCAFGQRQGDIGRRCHVLFYPSHCGAAERRILGAHVREAAEKVVPAERTPTTSESKSCLQRCGQEGCNPQPTVTHVQVLKFPSLS